MADPAQLAWATPDRGSAIALDALRPALKVVRCQVNAQGVATVSLHRPERRNSWTTRMNVEYRAVLAALDADPAVRVAVITGAGTTFCIGADSRALTANIGNEDYDPGLPLDAAQPGYGVRAEYDADLSWHYGLRIPVVAAVNGACAGIAVALAAFCDVRFAVAGAKVTVATPRLGLPSEYGLSWVLPRLMGVTHATDMILSGRVIESEELARMGFFNAVYASDDFETRVAAYADQLAAASPRAVTTAKRQLYSDLLSTDPGRSVRLSQALTASMMSGPDYKEGVSALIEKRAPVFTTSSPTPWKD